MCKRTIFTDSTKSFHIFLLKLKVLFPTRSPRNEFVIVREYRSILLTLYFCNAEKARVRTLKSHPRETITNRNPKRFRGL
jgi:hypothetical protein